VGMGLLAERDYNFALAILQISRAMKVQPTDVGYILLAEALRRGGHPAEAGDALARAHEMSSDMVQAERTAMKVMATAGINAN
jgi:hypothetical protein